MKPQALNLKILLPILVLLAAAGAAWAIIATKPQTVQQSAEPAIPNVNVVRAEPQSLRLNVMSQGVVAPRETIDLVSEVGGKVAQVHPAMAAGGFFAANELLLTIDPRDYDYAIVTAEAQLAEAQRVLINEQAQVEQAQSEWQALGEGEPSPLALHKPQLAEAQAKLKAAEADLAKAKLNRSRCELRAPFAGRVLNKQAGLGQYIPSGAVVARIYASDVAEIRLPIGTEKLAFLELPLGQNGKTGRWPAVTLRAELAGKPQSWQGRIVRSEAALDDNSGQLYLVAQIAEPFRETPDSQPLLSGLFVQAEIEGVRRDGLFILPRTALSSLQQAKLVNAEQRLEIRQLEVLRQEAERIVIKAGLNPGDRVVVSEMPVPVAGMQVNAVEAPRELAQ
ncbi:MULTISPECIES: efflux RND transporter periplasmic adaptor subunit [Methylomonas]|uniref:Efflux transporter periplasmic adaptor subunit n=2 Tax=Methylomonas TaxID=416 RepID=A0A126T3T9_9GAMM|nr:MULTISPECIES: efflux RND transporter periplasmic adaptor subunit [Methylomonas]AMK76728.1 efflux transporter periplasmic adaptor subunit [Methylomonas denitrificans]OAI00030.1 efflux transporter periplasmic adaptor subunit [Methylomonas methanica]TCV82779.1 RND family efflux transporter MFP subunit [Methylomonas methanica]